MSTESRGRDPVKSAYYSPKVFRRAHMREEASAPPFRSIPRWTIVVVLVAAGLAAARYWPLHLSISGEPKLAVALEAVSGDMPSTGILVAAAFYGATNEMAPVRLQAPRTGNTVFLKWCSGRASNCYCRSLCGAGRPWRRSCRLVDTVA